MRTADVLAVWRKLQSDKQHRISISAVDISELAGIDHSIALSFEIPLIVLCGANGVGKSAILQAIWKSLCPVEASEHPFIPHRVKNAKTTIEVKCTKTKDSSKILDGVCDNKDFDRKLDVKYIDSSQTSADLRDFFCRTQDFDVILEALSPRALDQGDVALLSHINRKDYTSISVYELDEWESDKGIIPYFVVVEKTERYDVRTMGVGEFAAFLL